MLISSLRRKIRGAGCTCNPQALNKRPTRTCRADGCLGTAEVIFQVGGERFELSCVGHFLEHAKACHAGTTDISLKPKAEPALPTKTLPTKTWADMTPKERQDAAARLSAEQKVEISNKIVADFQARVKAAEAEKQ